MGRLCGYGQTVAEWVIVKCFILVQGKQNCLPPGFNSSRTYLAPLSCSQGTGEIDRRKHKRGNNVVILWWLRVANRLL